MSSQPLKVGAVSYLNAWPLVRPLVDLPAYQVFECRPSEVAEGIRSGRFDLGLVPVIELLHHPELKIIGDSCIAALGRVSSVLLKLRRAPERVRSLSLDPHSRTSQVLAQLILRERFGNATFTSVERSANSDPLTHTADATLVIGDPALQLEVLELPRVDLAQAWLEVTSLPMVFAVWALRPGVDAEQEAMAQDLASARDRGLRKLSAFAARAAAELGLSESFLQVYLQERIRYRLGTREKAGLAAFLERARVLLRDGNGSGPACSTSSSSAKTPTS